MQYTIPVIVSLLSALTAAQFPFGDVPSCAVPCLTAAIIESSCEATDNACLCENFNVLRNQVETCAGDGCSPEDIGVLIRLSVEACAEIGETITPSNVPTPSDFIDLPTITSDATSSATETETETDTDTVTSFTTATTATSATSATSATGTDGAEPSDSESAGAGDGDGGSAAPRVQAAGWAVAGAIAAAALAM